MARGQIQIVGIPGQEWNGRAIGLLDLDAFFASVEQLDHPEWRGKPVIVGGDADRRGVVSTASYEARRFGVHSAMPSAQAHRLCPDAIWTQGHYDRYREMSRKVMSILLDETPYVEQVSIDEAFFDVTPGGYSREDPVAIVRRVQDRVSDLGVTCSIGLTPSKTASKIASELNKPDGLTVVYPDQHLDFLWRLPVRSMSGIGPRSEQTLLAMGIETIGDLAAADESLLEARLGVAGTSLRLRALGQEDSPVRSWAEPSETKSVSNERTFAHDIESEDDVITAMRYLCDSVARRLRKKGLKARLVTLKLSFGYGHTKTAQTPLAHATDDARELFLAAHSLLDGLWQPGMGIRLMGVGGSNFDSNHAEQETLFDDAAEDDAIKAEALAHATDRVRERFGKKALRMGSEVRFEGRTSNTAPLNKDAD